MSFLASPWFLVALLVSLLFWAVVIYGVYRVVTR